MIPRHPSPQSARRAGSDRRPTRRIMVMDNRIEEENQNNQNSSIFINNYQHGDILNYSLIVIKGWITKGYVSNQDKLICTVTHGSVNKTTKWDICNGEFKVVIELKKGKNVLLLQYLADQKSFVLEYMPRRTNLRVTPVYIICQGHDGIFQSPEGVDNSVESACSRIATGAKIIQSVTAEKLFESGFGRKAFQLEHEINSNSPECLVFRSSLNVNKARKMKQADLWTHFGRELMLSDLGSNDRKFLGFLSCTRYKGTDIDKPLTHEEMISITEAYVALGGGGLALFGTACLYTWPTSIDEILHKFLDITSVNTRRYMDDSGYRGTFGGCFATTIGSVLHELGHTFDLGHTKDGIMGRGFDNIDRVFLNGDKQPLMKDNMNNFSGKPVQHSTISLQRNINVTMNVAEPLRVLGPRSKTTLGNFASMSKSDIVRRSPNVTPITRPSSVYSSITNRLMDSKKNLQKGNGNDLIYWPRNCAVLLSYHRWFNCEFGRERQTITRYLKFDKNKMMIISTAGLRFVEVRDDESGMVIDSYEFTELLPEKRFLLPFTFSPKNKMLTVVVEDDLGNVLKQSFSY